MTNNNQQTPATGNDALDVFDKGYVSTDEYYDEYVFSTKQKQTIRAALSETPEEKAKRLNPPIFISPKVDVESVKRAMRGKHCAEIQAGVSIGVSSVGRIMDSTIDHLAAQGYLSEPEWTEDFRDGDWACEDYNDQSAVIRDLAGALGKIKTAQHSHEARTLAYDALEKHAEAIKKAGRDV